MAHLLNEPQTQASKETMLRSEKPVFITSTSDSPFLKESQESSSLGIGFTRPVIMQKMGPNIQKHVLLEVTVPGIKRSDTLNSSDFYTLRVDDLQKGPFH